MPSSHSHTPLDVPLGGDLLIEASAGTGKTYALTTLAARAVVEAEVGIQQLLVVTFTVAATGELQHRIRRTMREALDGCRTTGHTPSGQAQALLARWQDIGIDRADAAARLAQAVRDLDRANILTIHGLCQRLLTEFAFDGAIPFGFEVSGDDAPAVAAAVRDFWRRRLTDAPVPFLEHAQGQRFTPTALTDWVQELHPKSGLLIRGVADADSNPAAAFEQLHAVWLAEFAALRGVWLADGAAFAAALVALRWYKNSQPKVLRVIELVQRAFARNDARLLPLDDAGYLGSSLGNVLLKRPPQTLPESPLLAGFDRLGAAAAALEDVGASWLRQLRRDLLEDVRASLRKTAWRERQLSFNALLTETARALDGPSGPVLASRIRERFPLALVDEFQDTDSLQARILAHIYPSNQPSPPASAASALPQAASAATGLAIVGDPKQSIYRFRGADVFAYLQAGHRIGDRQLRLTTNYRSTPALVGAVNALFQRSQPFLLPELSFEAVQAASADGEGLLVSDDSYDAAPLQLRLQAQVDRPISKDEMHNVAAQGAAAEIAQLLRLADAGRATLNGAPLAGGDIAVLVRTARQGQASAAALRALGVQSVEMGDVGVFQTPQAEHLHRLLAALAEPGAYDAAARLRGALGVDVFGMELRELAALSTDDQAWAAWEEHFRRWRAIWRAAGVAALIRRLLFTPPTSSAAHLLTLPDGPRQLTNLLHLADLLQQAETSERLSRSALVDWLAWRRDGAQHGVSDDTQLRLESDERLVKVVTVHRAKGLEFPVVFCPFAWYRRRPWEGPTAQHHERINDGFREVLDLAPTAEAHQQEALEDQAEELRLLYVALTRAQQRCVVTWAQAKDYEYAPLAWLLHGREQPAAPTEQAIRKHRRYVRKLDAGAWLREVQQFAAQRPNEIGTAALAQEPATALADTAPMRAPTAQAHTLDRPLRLLRQMTSYSALAGETGAAATLAEHIEASLPDHDQREDDAIAAAEDAADPQPSAASAQTPAPLNAFTFPRGRRVGDCLHVLFEASIEPQPDFGDLCQATLAKHGLERRWAPVARTIIENVRRTPLAAHAGFRLADLHNPVAEMEFALPVAGLDRQRLGECLATHGYPNPFAESADAIDGFLRGFIDLVAEYQGRFYVLDYKSNWLGDGSAAYAPAALNRAMQNNGYHLQYLLYLAALNRYLSQRLPDYDYDRHLGGAFYLFVRAMTPERPGYSVFFDRPTRQCIEAIDACFGELP